MELLYGLVIFAVVSLPVTVLGGLYGTWKGVLLIWNELSPDPSKPASQHGWLKGLAMIVIPWSFVGLGIYGFLELGKLAYI